MPSWERQLNGQTYSSKTILGKNSLLFDWGWKMISGQYCALAPVCLRKVRRHKMFVTNNIDSHSIEWESNLVPRGCDPFGQHQGYEPLVESKKDHLWSAGKNKAKTWPEVVFDSCEDPKQRKITVVVVTMRSTTTAFTIMEKRQNQMEF